MSLTHISRDVATIVLSSAGLKLKPTQHPILTTWRWQRRKRATRSTRIPLRKSQLLPPFTRGQPSAGRRPRYLRRAIGVTAAKVCRCLSHAQTPLVLRIEITIVDFLQSSYSFLCWRHSTCLSVSRFHGTTRYPTRDRCYHSRIDIILEASIFTSRYNAQVLRTLLINQRKDKNMHNY